uniref:Putative ubiquinone oxidoreductase n=1 Tax=Ixodes ricinus TaxID=34613 RepID=A0A147BFA4_IXORI
MALIRSPFTDLVSSFENYEAVKRCRDFNMQLSLCKESYCLHRSEKMCRDEYEDFSECIFVFKQLSSSIFAHWCNPEMLAVAELLCHLRQTVPERKTCNMLLQRMYLCTICTISAPKGSGSQKRNKVSGMWHSWRCH